MKSKKLLILDKDGTLTTTMSGARFVQHPEDQKLLPGVEEALQRYTDDGWLTVIVSNQGGVAAGHKTLADVNDEMQYCYDLIYESVMDGCTFLDVYFCPDFEGRVCCRMEGSAEDLSPFQGTDFRKPGPGMLKEAISDFAAQQFDTPDQILYVGDRPEDQQAAKAAGVSFMWASQWRGDAST